MITGQLRNDVDRLWETFWTGGISNPLTVIEQITYLLFIKRLDDLQIAKEKKANRLGKPIEDPIYTPEEKDLRWSNFKNIEPVEMLRRFRMPVVNGISVFDKMKSIGTDGSAFHQFMRGATFMLSEDQARLLDKAVQMIDQIDTADQDTKGDLYEYLLSKISSAGQNGQFRTPRHIIRMMVDLVKPTPQDTICDPAAGTMGFLVSCIEYLKDHQQQEFFDPRFKEHFEQKMFTGIEFDSSMIRIGAMNLMLHGLPSPNLLLKDSLSEGVSQIKDHFSLVLANPPFKGSLDYDAVDPSILSLVRSKKTELLFLGLMLRILKTGGRAAVIVPDGVLFGGSKAHKQIRQEIIDRHQLQAVISMPSGVFKPYAGVSTAVLFFTKTNTGGTDQVWFYDMQADGYSLDDKRQPVEQNDIPDIVARWSNLEEEKSRTRTDRSFLVPVADIRGNDYNLSINKYKEIVYEKVEYEKPDVILKKIRTLDAERAGLINTLEGMVKDFN